MTINISGVLAGSAIKGEDPYSSMAGAAVGSFLGYQAGRAIQVNLNNKLNPWYRSDWIEGPLTIKQWNYPSIIPGATANFWSSFTQEQIGGGVRNGIDGRIEK